MPYQELMKRIFKNEASAAELQQIAATYPYFGAAHFFLLQKTAHSDAGYKQLAGKTALHFGNPLLLNYALNKKLPVQPLYAEVKAPVTVEEAPAKQPVAESQPAAPKEELLFEPLFATDYFASQGIKLSDEVQPQDKLGKQLKSFTEWLKTMKKLHNEKMPAGNDQVDITVQRLAEKSNKEDEIITESMAEVYAQQGKILKSKEIFQKLSLLNPAKSAYFAAKIEQLKEN